MDKSEKINEIIKKVGAKSYLEVGYGSGHNFNLVECKFKYACDPNYKLEGKIFKTILPLNSDDFFEQNDKEFDVIFIDGLHHAEQVRKDIVNALKCNPKAIILHDTLPKSKEMQEVPRNTKEWTGDVWRSAVGFHKEYPEVEFETYRSDYGLSVIYPDGKKARKHFEDTETSWEYFKKNAVDLLNIVD